MRSLRLHTAPPPAGRSATLRRPLPRRRSAPPQRAHAMLPRPGAGADALARRLVPLSPPARACGASPPLRLLQWNCLADGLAQNGEFVKCPTSALSWAHRAPLLLAEIQAASPDAMCLQEVNHFDELYASLRALGYEGTFVEKRNSPCVGLGFPADGVALFWRVERLRCVSAPAHSFYTAPTGEPYSQCFVAVQLADVTAGQRPLLLATTHLKAKAGASYDAVRCASAAQLAAHLSRSLQAAGPRAAVLLAGDFNTELDSDAMRALGQAGLAAVPLPHAPDGSAFTTWKFRTPGNGSGNGNGNGCGNGLEAGEKRAAIDHVLHSAALRPTAAWAAPGRDAVGAAGLPTAAYPSDHVAQLVELTWLEPGDIPTVS